MNRMREVLEMSPTMVATPSAFDPANETDITRTSEAANPKIVARGVNGTLEGRGDRNIYVLE